MRGTLLVSALYASTISQGHAFMSQPLPDRDGGGVLTCRECHMHKLDDAHPGHFIVEGLPERYTPGKTYELTVKLAHHTLMRAGFEASARTEKGLQAGSLAASDPRIAIFPDPASGVQYAHHTRKGTAVEKDSAAWTITWTAPDKTAGRVVVRAAGCVSNADGTPLGDAIVFYSRTIAPH